MKTAGTRRQTEVLLGALREELGRAMKGLVVSGHPSPHYVSYLVRDTVKWKVWGRYGAIWQNKRSHTRRCLADVRVGTAKYDQVTAGGLRDNSSEAESYDMIDLPTENNSDAIRFALWRLTDAKYREAVADFYSKKSRDLSYLNASRGVPSFVREDPEAQVERFKIVPIDEVQVAKNVRELSALFKEYPEIKNSYVEFSAKLQTKYFVNSEGSCKVWHEPLYEMVAHFWFLGSDNDDQSFTVAAMSKTPAGSPSKQRFRKQIEEAIRTAYAVHSGETLNSYAGPVLLCPKATGLFLHEAVGHRLEASRFLSDDEGRLFNDKIGAQIMHPDLSIFDDPGLKKWNGVELVGGYAFDDEGCKGQLARLVEDGKLVGFLTTRSPAPIGKPGARRGAGPRPAAATKRGHFSNGHARSQSFERAMSRMANLIVESKSSLRWSDLRSKLVEEVKRRGLPFGVILYAVEGGETGTDAYDFQAFLGQITDAAKIYPNGDEVKIRGVDFVGTPLACLNQILAVGGELEVDNGYCGAESGMVPVSTVAPAILVGNLELQAKDPTKVTHYLLPLPWSKKK
jgi:TldD protein